MNSHLQAVRFLILLFLLVCFPLTSSAAKLIYTFQIGSFNHIEEAQKQFDSIAEALSENKPDHLRIEKIGKFYSVRLGKFGGKYEADNFLLPIKNRLTEYLLMKAYYKEERIIKLYQPAKTEIHETIEDPLTSIISEKSNPDDSEREGSTVIETVQTKPTEEQVSTISDLITKYKYKEALEFVRPELAAHPEIPEMNGWYGSILLKLGQPDEAITYLRKAAELSPGVSDYHNGIGYCLFYLNTFHEAINAFNKAVTINPSSVDALAGLGAAYAKLGQKEQAMDVYDRLKNLDSTYADKLLQIINRSP